MVNHEELRAQYNPDGSDLRKAQLIMLEILIYVADVCQKNGLRYWLSSGTLLGAIRHEGFIPWDDDVDIEMPVEDFRKLKKIMLKDERYIWHDHSTDRHFYSRYAKIRDTKNFLKEKGRGIKYENFSGLFIDIFPVEKMPEYMPKVSFLILSKYNGAFSYTNNPFRLLLADLRFSLGNYLFIPLFRKISLVSKEVNYHHTYGVCFFKKRNLSNINDSIKVRFENKLLNAPKEFDKYLIELYGNHYMSLPPAKNRTTHATSFQFK